MRLGGEALTDVDTRVVRAGEVIARRSVVMHDVPAPARRVDAVGRPSRLAAGTYPELGLPACWQCVDAARRPGAGGGAPFRFNEYCLLRRRVFISIWRPGWLTVHKSVTLPVWNAF